MKKEDQVKIQNPLTQYYHKDFKKQPQEAPGLGSKMTPVPDCGEESYRGFNRLQGRKALVTGGDSGIGRAAAIAYAREGADVAINYLPVEQSDAEEVKKIIEAEGRKAVLIPGDLSDEKFCKTMVDKAVKELGGLDILALVAGKQKAVYKIEDVSTEQIRKTFEINVFSLFWTIKPALEHLPAGASIITTSSIQAYEPGAMLVDYAASKAAIVAFSQALAKQLIHKGIRVNVVAPGPIWTPLEVTGGQPQENIPTYGDESLMKRAGQPVELSSVYVFLASQESSYVTAEVYGVGGGVSIG